MWQVHDEIDDIYTHYTIINTIAVSFFTSHATQIRLALCLTRFYRNVEKAKERKFGFENVQVMKDWEKFDD